MKEFLTRELSVGGKRIVVLDGLFAAEEVKKLHQFLGRLPYQLTEIDTEEAQHNRNWAAHLPIPMATGMPLLGRCVELGREFGGGQRLELQRVYVNFNRYGDMQYAHRDAAEGVTGLYYANAEWKDDWGGETLFCEDNGEPVCSVAIRPGRLALFHPDILHRGGVPARDCWEPRMTVAFKLIPVA